MKRTQQCPKCSGRRLWVVSPWRVPAEYAGGETAPLAFNVSAEGFLGMPKYNAAGALELWTCEACGYSEFWATGARELREDPSRGISLVDSTVKGAGPFR